MRDYRQVLASIILVILTVSIALMIFAYDHLSNAQNVQVFDVASFCIMALYCYIYKNSFRRGEKFWSWKWLVALAYNFLCLVPALMLIFFAGGLLAYLLHLYSPIISLICGLVIGAIIWRPNKTPFSAQS